MASTSTSARSTKRGARAARAAVEAVTNLAVAAAGAADAAADDDDDDDDAPDPAARVLRASALFGDVSPDDFDHVAVRREGPIEEGSLGRLPTDATEETIHARWGGGKFKLFARTSKAKILAVTTIDIAGEPRFRSAAARKQYADMVGITDEEPAKSSSAPGGGVFEQMFAFMQVQSQRASEDHARRRDESEAAHRRDLERLKAEAELRRADAERAAERDRRLDEERATRIRRENEEARQRDREFQAMMLEGQKRSAVEPIGIVQSVIELAGQLQNRGGDEDPLAFLAKALPQILGRAGAAPPPALPASAAGGGAAGATTIHDPNAVVLEGALAQRARRAIEHIQAQGVADVGQVLEGMFESMLRFRAAPPASAAPRDPAEYSTDGDGEDEADGDTIAAAAPPPPPRSSSTAAPAHAR